MPPAVKRLMWWFAWPFAFTVAGAAAYEVPMVRSALSPANTSAWWVPAAVNLAVMFAAGCMVARGQWRIKRAVKATGGRACVACVYDLRSLGDTGTCPECGHAFDTTADQRRWARVQMLK